MSNTQGLQQMNFRSARGQQVAVKVTAPVSIIQLQFNTVSLCLFAFLLYKWYYWCSVIIIFSSFFGKKWWKYIIVSACILCIHIFFCEYFCACVFIGKINIWEVRGQPSSCVSEIKVSHWHGTFVWTEWLEAKGYACLCLPSAGIKRMHPQSRSCPVGSEKHAQALASAWKVCHRLNYHSGPFSLNFAQISML